MSALEVERKSVKNAFKSIGDCVHAALGFLACLVNIAPYGWIPSLVIILAFIAYEALEAENPTESYFDLVEFICGFVLGLPILLSFA